MRNTTRIVFWHDPEQEFEETFPAIELDGVNVLSLNQIGSLELKIRLEIDDPASRYLLYAPFPEPELENDWLLDIRLYSRTFYADRASIVLSDLELTNQAMRHHLASRKKFFSNQERLNRLKKWVLPGDTEREIDLKILGVLTKADQPDAFNILMKLFSEYCHEGKCNLQNTPKTWADIEKYDVEERFWEFMATTFGYAESAPNLVDLLIRLLVTDFSRNLRGELPIGMQHFLLPDKTLALNASVFLSHYRSHMAFRAHYDALSKAIAQELKVRDHLEGFDENALIEVMTFEEVERHIIRCIRDRLLKNGEWNGIRAIIQKRRDGHWANPSVGAAAGEANLYSTVYDAVDSAADLIELRRKFERGLSYPNAVTMFEAYLKELYRFDQLYRLFHESADAVDFRGWDVLKLVRQQVESCYSEWYLDQIAVTWGSFIDEGAGRGLLNSWFLPDIRNQQDFYQWYCKPILDSSPKSKVYVLISDAFRYEAAEELAREINSKKRFSAKLDAMLGVLPSYTGLGMAALLPHQSITYKANASAGLLVDGKAVSSLEERAQLLNPFQGTAVKAEDLISMNKDQGREFVKPWRVVYVYHNQIDATGDNAATESRTFHAVRTAIQELSAIVAFIINSLNGSLVLVTADHGFIYQDSAPSHIDKSGLESKPAGTLKAKKRYLLGTDLEDNSKVWHGETRKTASTAGAMEFWVPKGANRFHFAGGARFVHGGAMLQEIAVPVMTIKQLRGEAADKHAVRKVDVSLLGSSRKVVTNVQRFDFIQTDALSERVQPRTLFISLRDGDELISDEATLTFDSQSSSMEERKKTAKLILKAGQYDKKKEYHLVLRDAETKIEYDRIPVAIDLAFMNEF